MRPKARSNTAKPLSLPDIPSTQPLAWLMILAANGGCKMGGGINQW